MGNRYFFQKTMLKKIKKLDESRIHIKIDLHNCQSSLVGNVTGYIVVGIKFESLLLYFFKVKIFIISFGRTNRQTKKQTNKQRNKQTLIEIWVVE